MTTISKVWTAGIAYVALAVGAGLSIMYNILDTVQVRGSAFDWADLVTAVAAPAIVLLMVEMFVSRIWVGQNWRIQIIRWLATVAIGGVAMRTSWTHGHDFMASRGQAEDVATLWPLAIDLLAIMATALILAGRTRGHVAMPLATEADTWPSEPAMATPMATEADGHDNGKAMATVATVKEGMANGELPFVATWQDDGHGHEAEDCADVAMATEPVATQPLSPEYAATLAAELDAWGTAPEPRTFSSKVPSEAVALIGAWRPDELSKDSMEELMMAYFGKSNRTIRRWRSLVTGMPTSGA